MYTYTFDGILIHNNAPYAPQVERKLLVEFKTTSTLKRWEHELQKFEIAVYTGTREIANPGVFGLSVINKHLSHHGSLRNQLGQFGSQDPYQKVLWLLQILKVNIT